MNLFIRTDDLGNITGYGLDFRVHEYGAALSVIKNLERLPAQNMEAVPVAENNERPANNNEDTEPRNALVNPDSNLSIDTKDCLSVSPGSVCKGNV